MVEMEIEDVVVREEGSKDERCILLRERDGTRRLAIWTGSAEGDALVLSLYRARGHRPVTADLTAALVRALGARVDRVAITRFEDSVFYATVVAGGQEVDARPSDAINLARRLEAPIVVSPEVLAEAGLADDAPAGEWRSLTPDMI
jgi:uncharacterized protein